MAHKMSVCPKIMKTHSPPHPSHSPAFSHTMTALPLPHSGYGVILASMNTNFDQPVLQVDSLDVRYGNFHAVKKVSFQVKPGEIFGLLGPNGAGKTSTLSAVEGLLTPNAGTITVAGYDNQRQSLYARASMGVQLQSTSFQPELTVSEIIRLYAGIHGVSLDKGSIANILDQIKLQDAGSKRFGQLSGGQQQRVSLVIATIHNPPLVLMDEPTTGLDPQSRRHLWERMEAMRDKGHAILLTTHSMEEAESVCDRIAIIDYGQIITTDTPQAIIDDNRHKPEVIRASRKGRITLEDVFIGLTGDSIRA
jgi:ABC-2 type transport system ATP-binding protein